VCHFNKFLQIVSNNFAIAQNTKQFKHLQKIYAIDGFAQENYKKVPTKELIRLNTS